MAIDFSKWDKIYKITEAEVQELNENGGLAFPEVPYGTYEVSVEELELASSKKGDPMLKARFKILDGNLKGSSIFMNNVLTQSLQIHRANEFMKSLDTGIDIKWTGSYYDYADLIDNVFDEVKDTLEYVLEYSSNSKGYPVFKILDVFDK